MGGVYRAVILAVEMLEGTDLAKPNIRAPVTKQEDAMKCFFHVEGDDEAGWTEELTQVQVPAAGATIRHDGEAYVVVTAPLRAIWEGIDIRDEPIDVRLARQ
jgi:hypothetical protein